MSHHKKGSISLKPLPPPTHNKKFLLLNNGFPFYQCVCVNNISLHLNLLSVSWSAWRMWYNKFCYIVSLTWKQALIILIDQLWLWSPVNIAFSYLCLLVLNCSFQLPQTIVKNTQTKARKEKDRKKTASYYIKGYLVKQTKNNYAKDIVSPLLWISYISPHTLGQKDTFFCAVPVHNSCNEMGPKVWNNMVLVSLSSEVQVKLSEG